MEATQMMSNATPKAAGQQGQGANPAENATDFANDTMEGRSPSDTPREDNRKMTNHNEVSPTDVAGYNHSAAGFGGSESEAGATNEFDAIKQEVALVLEKKLESNRGWVNKLVSEISAYTKTLSDVHAEYNRILLLEQEESQRLDQVEPDVQGATSHLLANLTNGDLGALGGDLAGLKRKSDQA